ncbi:MAG: hypothetical protein FWG90_09645 [Oscillospiraceae bacterium]|nr:hypothetical protein [Oscillospiraceae bacterium]
MKMVRDLSGRKIENQRAVSLCESALLASGIYKSEVELTLSGYKTYQRRYVLGRVTFRLLLVAIAAASSIMMLLTGSGSAFSGLLLIASIAAGWYFFTEPMGNRKKLKQSLELLSDMEYKAEIYTDKVVISTLNSPDEENSNDEREDEKTEETPPSTIIHLDSHIVDLLDREDLFIICVKKSYVFIIPKSAFKEDEIIAVKEKLPECLGVRYKVTNN